MSFNQNACYQLTVTNTSTGKCFSCVGHTQLAPLVASCCYTLAAKLVGTGGDIPFDLANPSDVAVSAQVRIRERSSDGTPTDVLALNGLPPGVPWEATYTIVPDGHVEVNVDVTPLDHDPFAVHALVIEVLSADGTTYQEIAEAPIVTSLGGATSVTDRHEALSALRIATNGVAGTTHITFSLDMPTDVRVDVVDATGRLVRSLAHGRQSAGSHSLVWDGRDSADRRVGAGVLFLRAKGSSRVQSMKMLHLR